MPAQAVQPRCNCIGASRRTAHAMVFTQCTCSTTRCGNIACMAVSSDAPRVALRPDRRHAAGTPALPPGPKAIRMSSRRASAIHLPDALIHRTPSSFMELLPVLACVSSGSLPTRCGEFQQRLEFSLAGRWRMFSHSCLLLSFAKTRLVMVLQPMGGGADRFARAWPILMEALKIAPTGMMPPSLCAATAASPMDATHPHEPQSGFAAELAGNDFGFQVRRQRLRGKREDTFARGCAAAWQTAGSSLPACPAWGTASAAPACRRSPARVPPAAAFPAVDRRSAA